MRMIAAVLHETGLAFPYKESQPYRIEEVDLEGPGDDEVLVEVQAAGLCHSDLSAVAGRIKRQLPVVAGHEGAGIVREVGSGVRHLKQEDHVVMTVASGCGYCRHCRNNRTLLCEAAGKTRAQGLLPNGSSRLSIGGRQAYHYAGISSFAQYMVTVPEALVKIDPSIPLDVAAMFGCAVATGAGSVFNAAKMRPGESVAVIGLGGVGLNTVMAAKIAGASHIIGIDINDDKFDIARELGCTKTFSARDPNLVEAVRELTDGGVDFSFEISGSKPGVSTAISITCRGGEVVCVGIGDPSELHEYSHASLIFDEKVMRGTFMGSGMPERDTQRYLKFYKEGRMPVDRLKSNTMTFADLNHGLDLLHRGEVVRQILLPHA